MPSPLHPLHALPLNQWAAELPTTVDTVGILERGQLLYFPQLAFELDKHEQTFLSPFIADPKTKNISYDSTTQLLKGGRGSDQELAALKNLLIRFANQAQALIAKVLPHYSQAIKRGRTSFRPVQVSDRHMSYRKDDRLLHVDAFVATPNQGQRILRVFSNINPHGESRVWRVGEAFETVAQRFLPSITKPWPGSAQLLQWLKITKSQRTEYDHIMLQLHDRMKKDGHYQKTAPQTLIQFPPSSSWIVQTDQVSHAAMSGQHLLEQTFYLPVAAMQNSALSPLRVLERLTKRTLS